MTEPPAGLDAALAAAADEHGLDACFVPLVRPLFTMPRTQWPECCAGNCLPCARTLVAVALATCARLQIDPPA